MVIHRLVLVDRGAEHRHQWGASCVCGWPGVMRRRRRDAEKAYRQHVNGYKRGRNASWSGPRRRECTPVDDLPEALR